MGSAAAWVVGINSLRILAVPLSPAVGFHACGHQFAAESGGIQTAVKIFMK